MAGMLPRSGLNSKVQQESKFTSELTGLSAFDRISLQVTGTNYLAYKMAIKEAI